MHMLGATGLIGVMQIEERAEGKVHIFPDDCQLITALIYIIAEADEHGADGHVFLYKKERLVWNKKENCIEWVRH